MNELYNLSWWFSRLVNAPRHTSLTHIESIPVVREVFELTTFQKHTSIEFNRACNRIEWNSLPLYLHIWPHACHWDTIKVLASGEVLLRAYIISRLLDHYLFSGSAVWETFASCDTGPAQIGGFESSVRSGSAPQKSIIERRTLTQKLWFLNSIRTINDSIANDAPRRGDYESRGPFCISIQSHLSCLLWPVWLEGPFTHNHNLLFVFQDKASESKSCGQFSHWDLRWHSQSAGESDKQRHSFQHLFSCSSWSKAKDQISWEVRFNGRVNWLLASIESMGWVLIIP